jgi:hypothetical protein
MIYQAVFTKVPSLETRISTKHSSNLPATEIAVKDNLKKKALLSHFLLQRIH